MKIIYEAEGTPNPTCSKSHMIYSFFVDQQYENVKVEMEFSPKKLEDEDMVRVYYNDTNWNRLAAAEKLAREHNVMPIQIALSYVLNQSFPTSAIAGPLKVNELTSSVEDTKLTLSKEEEKLLTTP